MPDPRRGEFKTTAGRNPHFFIKGLPSDFSLLGDVGGDWNMTFMTFHTLGTIIPTDEVIFFRGVGIPPTSWMAMVTLVRTFLRTNS